MKGSASRGDNDKKGRRENTAAGKTDVSHTQKKEKKLSYPQNENREHPESGRLTRLTVSPFS